MDRSVANVINSWVVALQYENLTTANNWDDGLIYFLNAREVTYLYAMTLSCFC